MEDIVSVVIPTHGGGKHLGRCIESVLNQTYPYIEVIVVDDNGVGTDAQISTSLILNKYADDSRVKYICHDINKNGSAARNTGFKCSKGQFIGLLDDDDCYLHDNIMIQITKLKALPKEYGATSCGCYIYSRGKRVRKSNQIFDGQNLYRLLMHKLILGSSSMLIKRGVYEELGGFDESFRRHQDWEFTARLMEKYKVKKIDYIGFERHLEMRNGPKTPKLAVEYREHFLNKMKKLINSLPPNEQKDIRVFNTLDALFEYVKSGEFRYFFKEYRNLKPGFRGIIFIINRVFINLKPSTILRKFNIK